MRTSGLFLAVGLLFGVLALVADEPERDQLGGFSVLESLNELISNNLENHEKLVKEHGAEHPSVKRSKWELASLESMRDQQLKKMPSWARRDVSSMNDVELRSMIGALVERVIRLEDDVEKLKNPEVRIELLGTDR